MKHISPFDDFRINESVNQYNKLVPLNEMAFLDGRIKEMALVMRDKVKKVIKDQDLSKVIQELLSERHPNNSTELSVDPKELGVLSFFLKNTKIIATVGTKHDNENIYLVMEMKAILNSKCDDDVDCVQPSKLSFEFQVKYKLSDGTIEDNIE
jgi:hypothetical protein